MNILWISNVLPVAAAEALSLPVPFGGSWIQAMLSAIRAAGDCRFAVAAPADVATVRHVDLDGIRMVAFPRELAGAGWDDVVNLFPQPDLVHLHGTEYRHGARLMRHFPDLVYVTSLQGVMTFYAKHFAALLPERVMRSCTLRDLVKRENLNLGRRRFERQGAVEAEILKHSRAVIGRTVWDRACAHWLAPEVPYHVCGENLRDVFYQMTWRAGRCERHSIFLSQANYPIKGLHLFLEAVPLLLRDYPDLTVYVAGYTGVFPDSVRARLRQPRYFRYLEERMTALGLKDRIRFTGPLDAAAMCCRLTASHVFVMPSAIENSPNSLGEAMLTGVPCVAADVGGVKSMMADEREGLLYPLDEPYMLAYQVHRLFSDGALAERLSEAARLRAAATHDRDKNAADLLAIYRRVLADGCPGGSAAAGSAR